MYKIWNDSTYLENGNCNNTTKNEFDTFKK